MKNLFLALLVLMLPGGCIASCEHVIENEMLLVLDVTDETTLKWVGSKKTMDMLVSTIIQDFRDRKAFTSCNSAVLSILPITASSYSGERVIRSIPGERFGSERKIVPRFEETIRKTIIELINADYKTSRTLLHGGLANYLMNNTEFNQEGNTAIILSDGIENSAVNFYTEDLTNTAKIMERIARYSNLEFPEEIRVNVALVLIQSENFDTGKLLRYYREMFESMNTNFNISSTEIKIPKTRVRSSDHYYNKNE